MKRTLFFVFISLSIINCSSDNSSDKILEGDFSGTFQRANSTDQFATSEVSLTFENGTFEGFSDINEYPAICNGTFEVDETEVIFENTCAFTADFDWTYILDGTFEYTFSDDELRISRKYNSTSSDTYILVQEE